MNRTVFLEGRSRVRQGSVGFPTDPSQKQILLKKQKIMKFKFKLFNQHPLKIGDVKNQMVYMNDHLGTPSEEIQRNQFVNERDLSVNLRILYRAVSKMAKIMAKVQRWIIKDSMIRKDGIVPTFKNEGLQAIESIGCDIRELSEYEIKLFYNKKYKMLDLGDVFSKEFAEEQLDKEDFFKNGSRWPEYTDEQWDHILENLWADDEYAYVEDLIRSCLTKVHNDFPVIYEGLRISPLNDDNYDFGMGF